MTTTTATVTDSAAQAADETTPGRTRDMGVHQANLARIRTIAARMQAASASFDVSYPSAA